MIKHLEQKISATKDTIAGLEQSIELMEKELRIEKIKYYKANNLHGF